MNQDIWKIIRTAQVAVAALLLTVSCTEDPMDGGGGLYGKEYVDFTMELQPPGGYTPAESRAMTDKDQNAINSATVLVYKTADQTLLYHKQGTVTKNQLTVNLKTSKNGSDLFDIVVIGNPPSDFNPTAGQTKVAIQAALTSSVTGKWTGTEFMMWGERKSTLITFVTNNLKIEMLRSLARIDIGVGAYDPAGDTWAGFPNFVLTDVRVLNTRNKFAVIPLPANVGTEGKMKVTAPSIPAGTGIQGQTPGDALKYSGEDDIQRGTATGNPAYINSTIFVAEAPVQTAPNNEPPVILIVGGIYQGIPGYYRIDLGTPKTVGDGLDYLPILRNYRYRVTITAIEGPGATSPEQALSAPPMNLQVTLEPISENENGGDILFNDQYYITTDVSEVQIYGTPNARLHGTPNARLYGTPNARLYGTPNERPYGTPNGEAMYDLFTVRAGTKTGASINGTVTGPGISELTLNNGEPQLVTAPIPVGAGPHIYTVKFGTLEKTINVTVQAPLEGVATVLPFTEVASITTEGGGDWLTLSHNATYVQGEQKSGFIEGDAQGKAYMHLATNFVGNTRFAEAIVTHNDSQGTTRVMLEQVDGEIVGYFGGDPTNTMNSGEGTMYPKQLVVASVESSPKRYNSTGENTSFFASIYYGRNMNIEAAALSGSETLADFPAFEYCAGLNRDLNGDGKISGLEIVWYLPSQRQLMAIFVFKGISINSDYYWSATQSDLYNVFYVDFSDGTTDRNNEYTAYKVRCVRDL